MLSMEQIKEQITKMENEYGVKLDTWGTKKEFKALPEVLHDNEEIQYLTSGYFDGNTWMIACTNKRVVGIDKGMFFGMKQTEIPLDKISSISFKKGLTLAKVEIVTSSSKIVIENIFKNQVDFFVRAINKAIETLHNKDFKASDNESNLSKVKNTLDYSIEQLEKLAQLKEKGILTEDEFQAKKKQILGI